MPFQDLLQCSAHKIKLSLDSGAYICGHGCVFPIISEIPRFVSIDNYASSFGLQWNTYKKTQLDSYTGVPVSRQRLQRLVGGNLAILEGKIVLEAGCGAGRFTEVLLSAGSKVFSTDLSTAVEANYDNCKQFDNYFICQANILDLPLKPEQFDVVICIGVLQHTPDPEQTIKVLCSHVKPGGMLIIDHYTYGYQSTLSRKILRFFLRKAPREFSLKICQFLTSLLWPVHVYLRDNKSNLIVRAIRRVFLWVSPVVDHQDGFPDLKPEVVKIWSALDTHDTLTDYYKHLRSAEEIRACLTQNGMTNIVTEYAGNGVEARAAKPVKSWNESN